MPDRTPLRLVLDELGNPTGLAEFREGDTLPIGFVSGLGVELATIDALLQALVETVGENTPPTGVEGQRFIVGTAPTGAWAGQANKLARFLNGAWQFYDARYALNADDGLWYVRSASTWTSVAGVPSDGSITNAKLADVPSQTIKGRTTAGTGDPEDLSAAQVRAILNVAEGATANQTDAHLKDRANHTGSQLASTISDFATSVRSTVLSGLSLADSTVVAATDSVLQAIGKLAARLATAFSRANHTGEQAISTVTGLQTALDSKQATLVSGANIKTVGGNSLLGSGNIELPSGGGVPTIQQITSSRTLALEDANTFNVNGTANAYTATIPAQASVAWAADTEIHFLRSDAGAITITAAAGVTLNGVSAGSATMTVLNGAATIKRIGVNAWWIGGLLS